MGAVGPFESARLPYVCRVWVRPLFVWLMTVALTSVFSLALTRCFRIRVFVGGPGYRRSFPSGWVCGVAVWLPFTPAVWASVAVKLGVKGVRAVAGSHVPLELRTSFGLGVLNPSLVGRPPEVRRGSSLRPQPPSRSSRADQRHRQASSPPPAQRHGEWSTPVA